jgi:hypothetical protein
MLKFQCYFLFNVLGNVGLSCELTSNHIPGEEGVLLFLLSYSPHFCCYVYYNEGSFVVSEVTFSIDTACSVDILKIRAFQLTAYVPCLALEEILSYPWYGYWPL